MNMFWCACIYIFVCACVLCICVVVAAAAAVAWEKTEGNSHKLWLSEWLVFCTHSTEPNQVTRMTGLSKFSQKHNIFGTQWILRTRLCKWSEEKNFFIQERFSLRGWIWHFRYHFVCVCMFMCNARNVDRIWWRHKINGLYVECHKIFTKLMAKHQTKHYHTMPHEWQCKNESKYLRIFGIQGIDK